jgi:hypothetical protein
MGITDCCARAASGHVAAEQARVMKSRRLNVSTPPPQHGDRTNYTGILEGKSIRTAHVCFV